MNNYLYGKWELFKRNKMSTISLALYRHKAIKSIYILMYHLRSMFESIGREMKRTWYEVGTNMVRTWSYASFFLP